MVLAENVGSNEQRKISDTQLLASCTKLTDILTEL
jgi:hypothetical protein